MSNNRRADAQPVDKGLQTLSRTEAVRQQSAALGRHLTLLQQQPDRVDAFVGGLSRVDGAKELWSAVSRFIHDELASLPNAEGPSAALETRLLRPAPSAALGDFFREGGTVDILEANVARAAAFSVPVGHTTVMVGRLTSPFPTEVWVLVSKVGRPFEASVHGDYLRSSIVHLNKAIADWRGDQRELSEQCVSDALNGFEPGRKRITMRNAVCPTRHSDVDPDDQVLVAEAKDIYAAHSQEVWDRQREYDVRTLAGAIGTERLAAPENLPRLATQVAEIFGVESVRVSHRPPEGGEEAATFGESEGHELLISWFPELGWGVQVAIGRPAAPLGEPHARSRFHEGEREHLAAVAAAFFGGVQLERVARLCRDAHPQCCVGVLRLGSRPVIHWIGSRVLPQPTGPETVAGLRAELEEHIHQLVERGPQEGVVHGLWERDDSDVSLILQVERDYGTFLLLTDILPGPPREEALPEPSTGNNDPLTTGLDVVADALARELPEFMRSRRVPLQFGAAASPTFGDLLGQLPERTEWGVAFARMVWLQSLHVIQHEQPDALAGITATSSVPWVVVVKQGRPAACDELAKAASAAWRSRDPLGKRCQFQGASTWKAAAELLAEARLGARVVVVAAGEPSASDGVHLAPAELMVWKGADQPCTREAAGSAAKELFRQHLHDDLGEAAVTLWFAQADSGRLAIARDLARALFRGSDETKSLRQLAATTARDIIRRFVSGS